MIAPNTKEETEQLLRERENGFIYAADRHDVDERTNHFSHTLLRALYKEKPNEINFIFSLCLFKKLFLSNLSGFIFDIELLIMLMYVDQTWQLI